MRDSSVDSRRKTPVVDFGVERHTLITGKIIQVFHHSSAAVTQCSAARVHSSRVRAHLLRGFLVNLSHLGRISRFSSNPFERRARRIFCLVPHQIPTEESTGTHFPDLDVWHFWRAHLGFQSEHQTRFRETLLTHFPVDQGDRFETYLIRFRRWNH
jgi:hypothetical protein